MRRFLVIVLIILTPSLWAEEGEVHFIPDTTTSETDYKYMIDLTKKPDAIKAVWLGAVLPGAGQIYNGSYWKLPIVYGALMGCAYAITWTDNRCSNFKTAYLDLYNDSQAGTVSEDPGKSYIAVLPNGYDLNSVGGTSTWMNTLKNRQSIYRRYRDYSILATVIVYALTLIDAYVDAQLFDFDISPDLSINIEPQIYNDLQHQKSAELKLAITF